MNLLMENWRKFITEDAKFFGKTFEEFKKKTDAGEHPLKVAKELKLKKIGQGSTRLAYELPDDLESVIKIINVELDPWSDDPNKELDAPDYVNPITGFNRKQKLDSNAWEADLQMQQRYPDVFPKSFEVAKDFSWILVERVELINGATLIEFLNLPATYSNHQLRIAVKDTIDYMYDKFVSKKNNYMSKYLKEGIAATYADPIAATYADPIGGAVQGQRSMPPQVRDVKSILSSPHNRWLFRAAAELGIPFREFKPSNFGLSTIEEEHLVLLDASLWKETTPGAV